MLKILVKEHKGHDIFEVIRRKASEKFFSPTFHPEEFNTLAEVESRIDGMGGTFE